MAKKGENIYQRKDGRWEARYIAEYDAHGKAKYRSVYARNYREVREKRQAALSKLKELEHEEQAKAGTVSEVSRAWISNNIHRWKESTACRYQEKLNTYILPEFGKRELSDLSTAEIESFLSKVQSVGMPGRKPVGTGTAGMLLTIFRQLRLQALRTDHQVRFAAESITLKRRKGFIQILTEKEEQILIARLKQNPNATETGILVCLFTGIRLGEICALKCENIDLDAGIIHIKQTMQRLPDISFPGEIDGTGRLKKTTIRIDAPKSESSVRDIPIDKNLVDALRRFHKPETFLLTGDRDHFVEPRTMENRFRRILKECGLKQINFHATRHTFATRCIERGVDPKTLSELLGHASVATTLDRYVHLSMRKKAEAMEQLTDLFTV